jgi:TRAP-type C4-dicarboxylate transport system permease small subunit
MLGAMIGLCGFACVQGWKIVAIMASNGQVSITAGIPMTIPYFSFVVGFGLITVAAAVEVLRRIAGRPGTAA